MKNLYVCNVSPTSNASSYDRETLPIPTWDFGPKEEPTVNNDSKPESIPMPSFLDLSGQDASPQSNTPQGPLDEEPLLPFAHQNGDLHGRQNP